MYVGYARRGFHRFFAFEGMRNTTRSERAACRRLQRHILETLLQQGKLAIHNGGATK